MSKSVFHDRAQLFAFSSLISLPLFLSYSILTAAGGLYNYPALKDEFEKLLDEGVDSPYLLSFLVDFYESELEKSGMSEAPAKRANEVSIFRISFIKYNLLFYKRA